MTEMVERVARALFGQFAKGATVSFGFDEMHEDRKDQYRADARAAIRAMREPDERILKVGGAVLAEGRDFRSIWDAAIGTAIGVPERELGRRGGMAVP